MCLDPNSTYRMDPEDPIGDSRGMCHQLPLKGSHRKPPRSRLGARWGGEHSTRLTLFFLAHTEQAPQACEAQINILCQPGA